MTDLKAYMKGWYEGLTKAETKADAKTNPTGDVWWLENAEQALNASLEKQNVASKKWC